MDKDISKIPFWNNLTENEKEYALSSAVFRCYGKNESINGFSDSCLGMIYIKKGSIRVYITSGEGREVTLFHISQGECCILSASCVIGQISLDVLLTAEEDTELLAINSGSFQKLMESNIYVKCFAYQLSTNRFSTVVWVMQQILFSHFDERLARLLLSIYEKTGNKTIKMTQEAMAQEANSAREVVARMLKQFASDGYIEINRGAVTIKNVEALKALLN